MRRRKLKDGKLSQFECYKKHFKCELLICGRLNTTLGQLEAGQESLEHMQRVGEEGFERRGRAITMKGRMRIGQVKGRKGVD